MLPQLKPVPYHMQEKGSRSSSSSVGRGSSSEVHIMGEKAVQQIFQGMNVKEMDSNGSANTSWVVKEEDICDSTSIGSMSEDLMNSECSSSSSSDLAEEEVSSSTSYLSSSSSSSNISNGPLYELSDLITHLPIK